MVVGGAVVVVVASVVVVLQIQRTGSGLNVVAGTQYKDAADRNLPTPIVVHLETHMSELQEQQLKDAIDRAVADRQSGFDDANMEHRFQAALAASHQRLGYKLVRREVPTKRAGRGYVDFLAATDTGQLIVVETKRVSD